MEIKQAVAAAKALLQDVFGEEITGRPRLEEVWLDDNTGVWSVTLGFYRTPAEELPGFVGSIPTYEYKLLLIDDKSGRLISIKAPDREAA